ncbi:4-hydroxy-tetrahydrodipicolinate synthase [Phycicoccus sonneratiae]|uniref:4-hydroxy-tetrahydrodipicolinate synthase n=1 Tax=Phycicoccus sonneratiae TaxID=2807628 RepID=A0ABS2CIP0_9MICO|nr:4-hydroxy-tetrahydrodipicolinate synthase [Phycicoccus sonneraticus]MBM6398979.1 4-hydroxy-tetrahydrodipicolinate synthase [Phycicoccus sonneraticus]
MTSSPFGRVLTAMVTPMSPDGAVDGAGVDALVEHLLATGHDGVVVNGTTGEASTLTDDESVETVRRVVEVGAGRLKVVAGCGSNDTAHAVAMARRMADAGADGLLLVSPYYNKPTQAGLVAHCRAVADATDRPVMLYDIPGRTAVPFAHDTLVALAEHPNVVAVKDAKGDLAASTRVMAATDLLWFSGEDALTLPLLAIGAVGTVSVVGHVTGSHYRAMLEAVDRGDLAEAVRIHRALVPVVDAIMSPSQGAIMAKAALVELGVIEHATVRLPLVESPPEHLEALRAALATLPTLKDA